MRKLSNREKTALFITIIVVLSIVFFPRYTSENVTPYQPETPSPDSSSNETNNNENTTQNETETYSPVFCEFATSTTCKHCPKIGSILYRIYDEGRYPLSVVSLVYDKNSKAKKRLTDDYNVLGFPTVFLNGGEKVIYGSDYSKSEVENVIASLAKQEKPNLDLTLSLSWDDNTSLLHTQVFITNNESSIYDGTLRVYLVETNSRWYDYDGKPYRFAFLDYTLDTSLSVKPDESKNFSSDWNASKYKPVDKDNLFATAVVFSKSSTKKYADPPENTHDFSAYRVDAMAMQSVGEGNLPPQVGFSFPKKSMINLRSKPVMWSLLSNTWVIGKTDVRVLVNDDGDSIKLEFYVDNSLKQTMEDEGRMENKEYVFPLHGPLFGKHTLKVKVYDDEGKTSDTTMVVKTFILLP